MVLVNAGCELVHCQLTLTYNYWMMDEVPSSTLVLKMSGLIKRHFVAVTFCNILSLMCSCHCLNVLIRVETLRNVFSLSLDAEF